MGATPVPVATKMESVMGSSKHEVAVRTVDLDGSADGQVGQVGQVIGEEAILHAVDAQLKLVAAGGRGDGVGARLLLAVLVRGHRGDELAG